MCKSTCLTGSLVAAVAIGVWFSHQTEGQTIPLPTPTPADQVDGQMIEGEVIMDESLPTGGLKFSYSVNGSSGEKLSSGTVSSNDATGSEVKFDETLVQYHVAGADLVVRSDKLQLTARDASGKAYGGMDGTAGSVPSAWILGSGNRICQLAACPDQNKVCVSVDLEDGRQCRVTISADGTVTVESSKNAAGATAQPESSTLPVEPDLPVPIVQ